MMKGEVDTPNQHKISMPVHENGKVMNKDGHESSGTDNKNFYTSATKVDELNAGAKFVLESKGPTLLHMPKYSTVLSFTAVLSSAVTLLLLVKNLVLQRACCPETLATVHVPLLLAEGIFWCPAGNWWHAGYHLTVSIAAPALLSLPFALDGLSWGPGFVALIIATGVSFYAYTLISKVLEQAEFEGHRFLRFRDVAGYVLGRRWGFYPVGALQIAVCLGTVVGSILLGGESMQIIYLIYKPNGSIQLYGFIIIFGTLMLLLSQLPSFHSLRYINLVSLVCCLGYSLCVVGGSIYVGHSRQAPSKSYSVKGSSVTKMFTIFNSLAIIITTFGNGIIPEIQATLAPPVSGKMFKGLLMCYAVVIATFFSVAGAGYWAFGNASAGNIFLNFAPSGGVLLIPNWLLFLANMFVIAELFAVALVYSQPTFEIFEGRSSSVKSGKFSMRNLLPRLIIRSIYVSFATLIAAALPFFGDINAIIGAFGFTPLDFVLPFVLYNVTFKPSKRTIKFWLNYVIIVVFSSVGFMGCISAVRQIALDASSYKLFANV